jgi:3-isopropylmalate dehydrogenase
LREASVVVLAGDGIGPEVVAEARRVVDAVAPDHDVAIDWTEHLVGGISIDTHGTALTDDVLAACRDADAVFLGAVGGPKWDTTDPDKPRPEQGLLGLRAGLGLYANLRPVRPWPALYEASPLRRERIEGTDLLVVRELTGGLYFGERGREPDSAYDTCAYTREEVARLAEVGFAGGEGRRREGHTGVQGHVVGYRPHGGGPVVGTA